MKRSIDIVNHQPMPTDGTPVTKTNQLTALAHDMPERNETNSTKQYSTGSAPKTGPWGARANNG